jgi:hypothetical protein
MTTDSTPWRDWAALPGYSGFKVLDRNGRVTVAQIDRRNFAVDTTFVYVDRTVLDGLAASLEKSGHDAETARRMIDASRTFASHAGDTDFASIPRFMAWFEGTYGRHTLAAMLHDQLIESGKPNTGRLKSDTLSDSFFRNMMGTAGVPLFKRWIMWAAVAMRTRWAGGGHRRISLVLWGIAALIGNALFSLSIYCAITDRNGPIKLEPAAMLLGAVLLPFASALLWGRQYGASVVAAAAFFWILPPAILAVVGLGVYMILEALASRFFKRKPTRSLLAMAPLMLDPPMAARPAPDLAQ